MPHVFPLRLIRHQPELWRRPELVVQIDWITAGMRSMTDRRRRAHAALARLRRFIRELGPYQSLVLLAIPTSLVEPLKLVAVAVAGEGHWITGSAMIVCAYAASLLVVERLFAIVKPKLLSLPWFARLWNRFVAFRGWLIGLFRQTNCTQR
jgi:hypothetical protein